MLTLAPELLYVYEPFSVDNDMRGVPTSYWYTYVTEHNADQYAPALDRIVSMRYSLPTLLRDADSLPGAWKAVKDYVRFRKGRMNGRQPLLKDPVALFSAEWLADRFDLQVLVTIRHPAAFAGSVKKLDWHFSFEDFLAQPRLMADHLQPYADEIRRYAETDPDLIDQAILLWNLLYDTVRRYRSRHDDWLFVRHEDLAHDPVSAFTDVYQRLDIPMTDGIRETIREHNAPSNPVETSNAIQTRRDSRSVIYSWKDRLTDKEIERVRSGTAEVARTFYSDEDW